MRLFIVLISLIFNSQAIAHESGQQENDEVRVLKTLRLPNAISKAHIVAREAGHVVGQNFQVELRLDCAGEGKDIHDLPVHDSFSVCDMDPDSLKLNRSNSAIAMKTKMADIDTYYQQIEDGKKLTEQPCLKKTKVKVFSLQNLCHK